MKKYIYEHDSFRMILDESLQDCFDDEDKLDIPDELVLEYKEVEVRYKAIQDKLYAVRKTQKGY
jgi:hypothetical protein